MECPFCGSNDVKDLGYEDGAGDYGDSLVQTFRCEDCSSEWDTYTIGDYSPDLDIGEE